MTSQQKQMLVFARLHNWGYDARPVGTRAIRVGTDAVHPDGRRSVEFVTIRSMEALLRWAGY